jgi:hypothetical protein
VSGIVASGDRFFVAESRPPAFLRGDGSGKTTEGRTGRATRIAAGAGGRRVFCRNGALVASIRFGRPALHAATRFNHSGFRSAAALAGGKLFSFRCRVGRF